MEPDYVQSESGAMQTDAQPKKNEEMKLKDLKTKSYLFQEID